MISLIGESWKTNWKIISEKCFKMKKHYLGLASLGWGEIQSSAAKRPLKNTPPYRIILYPAP